MTNEEVQEIIDRAEDKYDRLKDRVHDLYDENIKLKNTINKAIEYIEKNVWSCYILDDEKELIETDSEELLEILKGSDKE